MKFNGDTISNVLRNIIRRINIENPKRARARKKKKKGINKDKI